MSHPFSRRDALKGIALVVGAAGAVRSIPQAAAADAPHLSPTDPTAQALHYTDNAKSVDAKAFPTFTPDQRCANCLQFQGKAGDAWGPCNIFAGKAVNANGWCQVWVKKA
ncbi:MAG TPA: high-potential iron-sulfur protein [Steroidobacteraceae bacterium]|nr:high-potential iron-sulfur protein [Steroidobacteraceae bacterium]